MPAESPTAPLERRSGVTLGPGLAGQFRSKALASIPARRVDGSGEDATHDTSSWFTATLASKALVERTYLPLASLPQSALVNARTLDGYQHEPGLRAASEIASALRDHGTLMFPPPVLNARGQWRAQENGNGQVELQLFNAAAVVAGQDLILAYAKLWQEEGITRNAPFLVALDMSLETERAAYEASSVVAAPPSTTQSRTFVLKITTSEVKLEILSEPFVVKGRRGYAPMVDVRDLETGREYGLYVQAASIAAPLDDLRLARGGLTGARVAVRKEPGGQYAKYLVHPLRP